MHAHRRLFGGLALALALLVAAPTVALAASSTASSAEASKVPQTGGLTVPLIGANGTNAVATITSFTVEDGVLTAVGTVTGAVTTIVGGIPVTTTVTDAPFTAPITNLQPGGSCRILELDLGPIHLDVLGLIVDLSDVHLDITAQPGSGNLLGNLLCAVAQLLDNGTGAALQQIVGLLNRILGAL